MFLSDPVCPTPVLLDLDELGLNVGDSNGQFAL